MRLRPPSPPQRRPRLLVEELDPRILYSADAAALLGLAGGPGGAEVREVPLAAIAAVPPASNSAQVQAAREIVFIDSRVPDALALADQLMQQRGTGAMFDIVVLDANADGIAQVNRVLAAEHGLAAVHLIAHGSEGSIQLGSSVLDAATLAREGDAVARWGEALGAEGDLLLYGCNVAAGAAGQLFLHDLAALTGADVAASTGLTGAAAIGGDWTLEFATGTVRTQFTPTRFDALQWQGVLASYVVNSAADSGVGSLRQALLDANASAEADSITFSGVGTINLASLLPQITGQVSINGANVGGTPAVTINGGSSLATGLHLVAGSDGSTVRGLVIQNFSSRGLYVVGAANVTIAGNYVGTDAGGNFSAANNVGIDLFDAANARIGGTTAADRNVISGNSNIGINIVSAGSAGTVVSGNYIGTNAAGSGDLGNTNHGIYVNGASGITIGGTASGARNLISGQNFSGVTLGATATGITLQGNWIGLNDGGTGVIANSSYGVWILGSGNTVGGTSAGARNVISANGLLGIRLSGADATGNTIAGNYIGTGTGGTTDMGNSEDGIQIDSGASNNVIGGTSSGARNVIGGNNGSGISVEGAASTANRILGNWVGVGANGTTRVANSVQGVLVSGATGTLIGDGTAAGRNVLAMNGWRGISIQNASGTVVQGNWVVDNDMDGIELDGTSAGTVIGGDTAESANLIAYNTWDGILLWASVSSQDAASILANSIYANGERGIDFGNNGYDINDSGDGDTGPNGYQNHPALTSAVASAAGSTIAGNLNSAADATYRIDFYANRPAAADGANGEGERWLGSTEVTTNPSGNVSFNTTLTGAWFNHGDSITATATRVLADGSHARSSEFAVNITGTASGVVVVDTASDSYDSGVASGTVTVTTLGNSRGGDGRISLREAIFAANNTANGATPDRIVFAVPPAIETGNYGTAALPPTITLSTALPNLTQAVNIDASTQTGYAGTPLVQLRGNGAVANGLTFTAGSTGSTVRGFIIGNFTANGINITGGNTHTIAGNWIGLARDGLSTDANGQRGIYLGNSTGTTIGGTSSADRNVISGNTGNGLEIDGAGATGNVVIGNYIGTDTSGLVALGNGQAGVSLWGGASGNQLGSGQAGAGNVLSGNATGVVVGLGASNNAVQGNLIGLGADGSTALGNTFNGVWLHNGGSAALVTGNLIGTDADGSNDAAERNIISANQNGLLLENAEVTGNTIAGNYIGTDSTGMLARGNTFYGISISNGANGNTVGGSLAAQRNVVAGNASDGIGILGEASDGNAIHGNWIGANATGTGTLGNYDGIVIEGGADNTTIGGTGTTEGNWIVGNIGVGIAIEGASSGTVIQGNRIGTDAAGTANMGQGQEGIWLANGVTGTLVGGPTTQAANVIAFNGQDGMFDDGISVQSATSTGNVFLGNSIYNNVGLGIDLGLNGADPIDANDADTGPNNLLNTIVLSGAAVTPGLLRVSGTYTGAPDTWYRVEVFSTPGPEASGTGEGRTFLGSVNMPVGPSGTVTGSYDFGVTVADGTYLSATVTRTDSGYSTFYETSEFSNQAVAQAVGITVTPAGALATTEAGGTAQFSVVLDSQPTADVTIALSTSDATEGTLSSNSLTFTTANWNVAQVVTVTGVDDTLDDGDTAYTLITAAASSADVNYNGLNAADVAATNSDDDNLNTVTVDTADDTLDGTTTSLAALLADRGADGRISLREAITAANNTANGSGGADRIVFNIPDALVGGAHTITLAYDGPDPGNAVDALPTITNAVIIDASTEPDFAANGSRPVVVIDGNNAAVDGLTLDANADGSTVRGLVIRDFAGDAIRIDAGSDGNLIVGNFLGAYDIGGASAVVGEGNGGAGVNVLGANNTIGGTSAADRNLVGGNSNGVLISGASATGNLVAGNYIGTNLTGLAAVANAFDGVRIHSGATGNSIGGSTAAHRNVISANAQDGIQIEGETSDGNVVRGNYIGVGADGSTALGNGVDGILITFGADNTLIGGSGAAEHNVISSNASWGIELWGASSGTVVHGNVVGTDASGSLNRGNGFDGLSLGNGATNNSVGGPGTDEGNTFAFNRVGVAVFNTATGNAVQGNSIHSNTQTGIDLSTGTAPNGSTPNDSGDADTGGNGLQNFPVLATARTNASNQINLTGTLNSTANSFFRIEFFANTSQDASGHGEGQTYLGFANVATDASGNASISATLAANVAPGTFISATASRSDASYSTFTDTSEFAQNVVAAAPNQAPTGADGTVSATEDTVYTFAVADFGFSDADGDALQRVLVTTLPGQGTLRLNGVAVTAGDAVLATDISLGRLTYTAPADANGAAFTGFTFQVQDDGGTVLGGADLDASANTLTIDVAAVNDVPVNTVPATLTIAEDTPTLITGLSITDPDAGTGLLRTELTVTGGTLAATSGGGVVVTGSGTGALVLTGTLADLNAYLAGASAPTFTGAAHFTGAVTLNMVSADGNNAGTGGTLAAGSFDYRFHDGTPAGSEPNNIPTTGGVTGVASSFNGGALAIALTGSNTSFGVIYTGAIEITTAGTYSFSATADDAARVLIDGNPLVFAFFGSGSGSVALAAGRHTVEIRHAQDSGGAGLSVSYSGADTGNAVTSLLAAPGAGRLVSHTASTAITLTAVNDAPVNQLPGLQVTAVNTPLMLSVANGQAISVSDVDAGGAPLQMTLAATNGTLTLATTTGLTFSTGDGSADATLVFTGSAAAINAALDGMSFTPTGGYNGNATITVTTSDQGNTGSGGALADTDVLNVQVGAARFQQGVNGYAGTQDTWVGAGAPATDHGAATTVVADDNSATDAALLRFDALFGNGVGQVPLGSTITGATLSVYVTDADAADLIALHRMLGAWTEASTYNTLTGGVQADGAEASPGVDLTFDSGVTGWNNLSSAAITATVQAWANGATNNGWAFISNNADVWTFASSENATVNLRPYLSIAFTPPQAPVIGTSGGAASYTENGSAVAVDSALVLSDADSAQLTGASVRITANHAPAQDVLVFTDQNGITGNFVAATGTLTLSGSATVAQYQAALRSVTYTNTSEAPSTLVRTLAFSASDAFVTGSSATRNLNVAAVNDAPVLGFISGNANVAENAGALLLAPGSTVSDVDSANFDGGQVVVQFSANGQPEDRLAVRHQGNAPGQIGVAGSVVSYGGTAIGSASGGNGGSALVITLNANADAAAVQALTRNLTYENTSDNPSTAVRSLQGWVSDGDGGTSTIASGTITIVPSNDAPVVTPSPGSLNYNENSPATAVDPALTVADVDSAVIVGASVHISVAYASGEDVLGFTNQLGITGSWNAGSGALTLSGSASVADYQAALRSVTYRNTSEAPSIAVRAVEFTVNDGAAASTVATRQVQVVSIDDTPNTDTASASGTEDAASIAVTLTGSDVDGTVNRFRLIDLPVNGTLYLDAGLTTPAATATDIAATAQALTLYFVPAAHWNGSTSFQFVARDAVGMTDLTPATATITVSAVNDAPVLTASGAPAGYTENAAAVTIDPGATVTDADAADFSGGTLTASLVAGGSTADQLAVRHQGSGAGQIGVSGATLSFGGIAIGSASGGSAGAALVVTFNANADAAAVQALARQLTFASSGDAVSTTPRTVRMLLTDGDGGSSANADTPVLVNAVNDAPTISAPATASVAEDGTLAFTAGPNALVVQDADAAGSPLSLTLTASNGTVTLGSTSGLTFTVGDGSGDTTLIVSGTQAALNAALDGLGFTPSANHAGPASLQIDLSDLGNQGSGGALTATHTVAITVTAVNDAPSGAPAVSGAATEGQVLAADTSAIADADGLGAFTFQWQRNGVDVAGAAASTYLLGNADVGAAIRVRVGYVDGQGNAEQLTSASAGPVANVNDAPTGVPVIGGSAVEDQTLSADTTAIADADGLGPFTFQWQRDGVDVAGATASTYTLGDADVGAAVRVRVAYVDGHGTAEQLTSASAGPVANVNDAPTGAPVIGGSAVEDQTLTADTSAIADADGLGAFTLQWQRNGVAIAGATASTYTLGDGDVGAVVTVRASWTDGYGHAEQLTSAAAGPVANVNDTPTGAPAITGAASEDAVLAVDLSSIADADGLGAFTFEWQRNGVAIAGASAATYTPGDADVGATIRVRVGYVDGHGTSEALFSAGTAPIANVNDAPTGAPVVTGSASEDQALAVDLASIADADGLGALSLQWQRDGVDVAGATASTYALGDADVGAVMRVRVAYVDGHGMAEQLTSASTSPVANVNDAPAGVPGVTGTATEDQTLAVDTTAIGDADGLGPFTFQWQRNGVDVAGANASTYTLGDADVGTAMRVRVAYVDGHGTAEQLTSPSTGPVANVNDTPTGAPVIGGSAVEDQTLTVDTTSIADADGLGPFTLQWQRNGADIAGANGMAYTLGDADVGASIGVRVSWTDGHGTPTQLGSATVGPVANVDDTPSGAPVIAGSAVEDQTLTADLSSIADADGLGPFTLQWLRNGAAIAGASGSSYTLGDADVGALIRLRVDYLDGQGHAEQLLSASAGPVVNLNDVPGGLPVVTGSAVEDQVLVADLAAVSDADGLGSFTYQWLRDGVAIAGANGASHTLGDADVGTQIAVRIGWLDGQGTAEQLTGAAVGPIANVDDAPIGLPAVVGVASEYQMLTADTGAITDADGLGPFTYQWLRDGVVIAGASGASLTLGAADVGHPISVRVAYVDAQGTPTLLTSAPTAAVANVADAPVGMPALLGAATEGETLGADTGAIGDADGLGPFTFQWQRDGVDLAGANTAAYTLTDADVGAQLALRVSYTDGHGALETLTSAPTAPVANVNDTPTGLPVSTGVAVSGQVLVADTRAIADADGLGPISFTWLRNGVAVAGATAPSYRLADADQGQAISVRMSYVDGHGTLETLTSRPVTVGVSAETPPVESPTAPPTAVPPAGPAPAGDTPAAAAPADVPVGPTAPAPTVAPVRLAEPQAPAPDLATIDTPSSVAAELTVRASAAGSTPRSASATDYLALLAAVGTTEDEPGTWSLQDLLLVEADSGHSDFQSRPGRAAIDPNGAAGDDEAEALSWTQIAGVSSLALTAGTVWWALRAGGLLTSLMVSMPAWRHADLLAVLPDDDDDDAWDLADDEQARRDEEAVGDMFDPTADGAPR